MTKNFVEPASPRYLGVKFFAAGRWVLRGPSRSSVKSVVCDSRSTVVIPGGGYADGDKPPSAARRDDAVRYDRLLYRGSLCKIITCRWKMFSKQHFPAGLLPDCLMCWTRFVRVNATRRVPAMIKQAEDAREIRSRERHQAIHPGRIG